MAAPWRGTRHGLDDLPLILERVVGEEVAEALGFGAVEELTAVEVDEVVEGGDCEVGAR
jgi:hypothetical protein